MSPRAPQDERISSGRQAWRGRACRHVREVVGRSGSIVMCCVNQSSTSARCQPIGLPQCVRRLGNCPRAAKPSRSQRGRRVRREISRPLRISCTSGNGSLTQRGSRTLRVLYAVGPATEVLSVDDCVSIELFHHEAFVEQRVRSSRAECSAGIQGRVRPNATLLSVTRKPMCWFPGG